MMFINRYIIFIDSISFFSKISIIHNNNNNNNNNKIIFNQFFFSVYNIMKVSDISKILTYVMTSILIVFFILIIGKMIASTFTNIEYFREVSYNGVVRLNSKKDDEVLITPKMDLSDNMVSPVSCALELEHLVFQMFAGILNL